MPQLKLLLAGSWRYDFYEAACADALQRLGVEVVRFRWRTHFPTPLGRLQEKFNLPGPSLLALNRALLRCALDERPDVVFLWRATHVLPRTLRLIRRHTGALLASHNNDDPFSPLYDRSASLHLRRLWRYFHAAIPEYDVHFAYRQQNIREFCRAGAQRVHLLRSYYVPNIHRPMQLTLEEEHQYGCDVVLVGHYEPLRVEYLKALFEAGLKVRLFGWPKSWTAERLGPLSDLLCPIRSVLGAEYAKALSGAKICLCAFSRLNRDTYTRRVFEITACSRLLLCERTSEMQSLFREEEEAVYFSTTDEMVERAVALVKEPGRRRRIADAGRARCLADDHSVDGRMAVMLRQLEALLEESRGRV